MENKLSFYNTLTRKVEKFVPNVDGKVAMYTCGPTVYHFAHIGNLRSYIMEDILEKTLRYIGYDVKRVMNITDVGHLSSDADTGEDKMLKGAKREHKTVMEIAKFYTDAFFKDCGKLNIKTPDVVEPATNCIPEFIHMITVLLEKGYAYEAGGNIYFDTSKLKDLEYDSGNYHPAPETGFQMYLHLMASIPYLRKIHLRHFLYLQLHADLSMVYHTPVPEYFSLFYPSENHNIQKCCPLSLHRIYLHLLQTAQRQF